MSRLIIKNLLSGGVITNYHCVSQCGHCLYNCGPNRPKDYLDATLAEKIFTCIADLGCPSVHIGGGEPMLNPKQLKTVLEAARNIGMGIDYVETNSAWFIDMDQAEAVLNDLKTAGLRQLLISISPFHNAYVPFERVKGVINACRRTGIHPYPWVNAFIRDLSRLDEHQSHAMREFHEIFGPDYLKRIPDRYWIYLGGRALDTFRSVYPLHTIADILKQSPVTCASALKDTSHFHIDLYGNYIPGLCSGLAIDMADLGRPLADETYPLLNTLYVSGIQGLYEMACQTYEYTSQRDTYLNHCDLCTDIRHYLFQLEGVHFPELAPAGFYAERFGG